MCVGISKGYEEYEAIEFARLFKQSLMKEPCKEVCLQIVLRQHPRAGGLKLSQKGASEFRSRNP